MKNKHYKKKFAFFLVALFAGITVCGQSITKDFIQTPLNDVLIEIERQTGLSVIYEKKDINENKLITETFRSTPVEKVLSKVLDETVGFSIQNKLIVIHTKNAQEKLQQRTLKTVSGKVVEQMNVPIIGASIVEKGTSHGTISDENGNFTLSVSPNSILQVSYIGFISKEVAVENKSTLTIELNEDEKTLNEVIVVGYGTVSKKNLTTSISKVLPGNIQKAANSNVTQLLLGQAAGLQATVSSAQPGGNVNISIRGAGEPVYIVDGIIVPSKALEPSSGNLYTPASVDRAGLAGLNPEDIESIEILKDASASIYGIGAANGVILITTKKGKEGTVRINYDGSISSVRNYSYPEALNAQQYMNYVNIFNKEQYLYNNQLIPYGTTPYTSGWSPVFTDGQIAEAQTTDWKDQILRNGNISNHTLTINGGNGNLNYYISGNYFDQEGQMINSGMKRYTLHSTIGINLATFIKLSAGMNLNYNDYLNSTVGGNAGGTGYATQGALAAALTYPTNLPVKDENGKYTSFQTAPNPVGLGEVDDKTKSQGSYLNFTADIDIIKNSLSLKLLYGHNSENSRRSTYIPSTIYFYQMYSPRGNLAEDHRINQTLEATVMFNKNFFNTISTDFVLGIGRYLNQTDGMNISYNGGQYDAIANDDLASVSGTVYPGSYRSYDEKRSQFFRANFDLLDRYVISGTLRRDGTDKFFPDRKYAWFPAISMAWKISNESFLKNVAWINLLKIRASLGKTGSDNLGTTLYGTFGPSNWHIIFDNGTTKYMPIVLNGLDYPYVSWQKTIMKNIGLDFYILNNRISGNFDLFRNDISDILGDDNTAGLSIFNTYPVNGGHTRREGWDATLNSKNIITPDFTWTTTLTFSRYKSQWIERMLNYDYNTYEKRGVVTTDAWYYYKTNGIINADKSNMPASQPADVQIPGYPIIVDKNGDNEITIEDIEMRDITPALYWGLGNTFKYKDFDLSIFFYSQLGVYKYNYALDWAIPANLANQISNANIYTDRIWNSQTNPNGSLPGIAADILSSSLPGGVGTDVRYQDASFIRVRNITLGYTFRKSTLKSLGNFISNIRTYLDVQNPLTFTRFEGYDPEVYIGRGGASKGELPQARIFSAGINLSF
jgi:TonB-linked SusC/RagA family outer membrane protein